MHRLRAEGCLVVLKKCIEARVAGGEAASRRVEGDEVTRVSGSWTM